jgi:hypothetical protein
MDNHIEQILFNKQSNEKFKTARYKTSFIIKDMERIEDPSDILKECFSKCIDKALADSSMIDRVGLSISSSLLAYDICIPFRPIRPDLVDLLFNQFFKVNQSRSTDDNLFGAPFTLTVSTIKTKKLPYIRTTKGSGARFIKRQSINIKRNPDATNILKINNLDTFCLFYAINLMRIYISKSQSYCQFSRYKDNILQQKKKM